MEILSLAIIKDISRLYTARSWSFLYVTQHPKLGTSKSATAIKSHLPSTEAREQDVDGSEHADTASIMRGMYIFYNCPPLLGRWMKISA